MTDHEEKLMFQAIEEGIKHALSEMETIGDVHPIRDKMLAQFAAAKAIHFYTDNVAELAA